MRGKLIFLLLIVTSLCQYTQSELYEVDYNQNPPGLDWKVIDTSHYKVIFPQKLYKDAQRVANISEQFYEPVNSTLLTKPKKIPLILTSESVLSNGYVSLAPRRTEWWSTPPQSSFYGVEDWYKILALHELRHVSQFDRLDSGFVSIAGMLYGQIGKQLVSLLSVPLWVWEGDAVVTETVLSKAGRGRMPLFDMTTRANLLSGRRYPYYKAYLGSFKDRCPDHYELGYLMVTYINRSNGIHILSSILDRTATFSFYPFAFSSALSYFTGKDIVSTYEMTMNELTELWTKQINGLSFTNGQIKNPTKRKVWTSYYSPQYAEDGSIFAIKYGLSDTSKLVRILDDKYEELKPISILDHIISVGRNKVVWNQLHLDTRWLSRSYTDIIVYDFITERTKKFQKTKLFAPSISKDGNMIVAVEFSPSRDCSLVIIDASNGKELKRFRNPNDEFIRFPSWSEDGKRIAYVRQNGVNVSLSVVDVETGVVRDIISNTVEDISRPVFYKDYLIYQSPYSGIDNIYAVDINTGQRYQVTSRKFGAFCPSISIDQTKLCYADYDVDGYNIVEADLDPSRWLKIEDVEDRSVPYFEPMLAQFERTGLNPIEKTPIDDVYQVKDYNPLTSALSFHSWILSPSLPNSGLTLISTDLLNTTEMNVGIEYNANERTGNVFIDSVYSGLFPIISVGLRYGGRTSETKDGKEYYSWKETSLRGGITVPFNLSQGTYTTSISVGSEMEWRRISDQTYHEDLMLWNGSFLPIKYFVKVERAIGSSVRDIYPRWAQGFSASYQHSLPESDYKGSRTLVEGYLFFPGLASHHSLQLNFAYELQRPVNYRFESDFLFSRGYKYRFHEKLLKSSIAYAMPIAYPDTAMGKYFYLKRIRTNLFYDYTIGDKLKYQSMGAQLLMDSHFFTLILPIDFGLQYSYRISDKKHRLQFMLLGITF